MLTRLASTQMLVDIAIAVGRPTAHMHDAHAGCMPLPPAMPFANLGPLILGHHPLHVEEEIIFRAAAQFPIEAHHLDAHTLVCIHS